MKQGDIFKTNSHGLIEIIAFINSREITVMFLDTNVTRTTSAGNIRKGKVRDLSRKLQKKQEKHDLEGLTFGNLTVTNLSKYDNGKYFWNCSCKCGGTITLKTADVKKKQSCGCLRGTHKMSKTRLYSVWQGIKDRCTNPVCDVYSYYGGRGISYCKEWESFEVFYSDMSEGYHEDLVIDRIDSNGNYEKSNCRWASRSLNSFNSRIRSDSTTRVTGVSYREETNIYRAYITIDRKTTWLGTFKSFEDALAARKNAEMNLYGFIKPYT